MPQIFIPTDSVQSPEIQTTHETFPAMKNSRWLISFDHEGNLETRAIPPDVCVMTRKEMLEAINKGLVLDTNLLAEFAIATINNLKDRCDYVNNLRSLNDK